MFKKKNRTKCLSKRITEPLSKKGSFKRFPSVSSMDIHKSYTKSCTHQKSTTRNRSTIHMTTGCFEKEIVLSKDIDKKLLSAPNDERSTDPISSLMYRFGSLFQRRGSNISKTPESKQSPLSQSSSSICHISSNKESTTTVGEELSENFDKVRSELLTLKKFREGCE